jgi:ComF family protein
VAFRLQGAGGVLRRAADVAIRVLLAPRCSGCHDALASPLAGAVCDACWRRIVRITPPRCHRCGDAIPSPLAIDGRCTRCRRREPAFDVARSAGLYEGPLRELIRAFKFGRQRLLAEPLAALLLEIGGDLLADADAVVPVPLHPWRSIARGFNQADDLARRLERPVWRVLRRATLGAPQASVPAARRHANVRSAYRVRRARSTRLHDRIVVLVDDVMTTGATLDACSRALYAAGVKSVRALTVARAVRAPRPAPPPTRDPSAARRR